MVIKDALPASLTAGNAGALRAAAQQLRLPTSTSSFLPPARCWRGASEEFEESQVH